MYEQILKLTEALGFPRIPRRRFLYEYAKICIGKDMAPLEDEFGCAEAVNNICLKALGFEVGGQLSTLRMYNALRWSPRWYRVTSPEPGDLVLSPTGYGNGKIKNGHVGIMGKDGLIMSNNSSTGKWDTHLSLKYWIEYFGKKGGYPVYYYRVI